MKWLKRIFLSLFFLISSFFITSGYGANVLEDVERDFKSLQALIIGIENGEYIIDKGRAQGVKPKDIFMVYKRTKKVVHPETKESLGFLREPIGKVEVTRVEENFSLARVLSKKEDFPIPTIVRRSAELKIYVLPETQGIEEPLIFALKNVLPDSEIKVLKGVSFSQLEPSALTAERIDYVFVVGTDFLKVYNAYLEPVKAYGNYFAVVKRPEQKPEAQRPGPPPRTQIAQPFTFLQMQILGKMPGEVLQAEFADLDGDGQPELVYITQEELQIVKIKGGLLARYKPPKGKIIYVSTGPKGWIALNIYEPNLKMRSEVLKLTPQGLQPVIRDVNLFLQFVDFAGTGIKDTLIGQTFSLDTFFGKEVYVLKREDNRIVYGPKLEVADNFRLLGSAMADLDGDGEREWITYLPDGRLAVFKRNLLQFSTPFSVAKHFYSFTLTQGKKGQEVLKGVFLPYPTPIVTTNPVDGRTVVLYLKTEFPLEKIAKDLKRIPLNQASFQVGLLGYQGSYFFRSITDDMTGLPTGLGLWGNSLYLTVVTGEYPGKTETILSYRW
jgi:hypothetical protein